ncbi:MAG: ABC transporter ATP-binding protein [Thermoanaerobaculia bacterium]|nr:ABC transporter ATP-binding protein [Thermoanaerobaculia bacterium]
MSKPSLQLRDIQKTFEQGSGATVDVLRGVDLDLAPGESLAVLGPSGSGKSTLLHIVGTLERPTSGTMQLGEVEPFSLDDDDLARFRNRTVGFVFQDHHLLPQYSVLENVLVPTFAFGDSEAGPDRARQLLDRVGLSHRLDHRPAELSGGERQRVAVARSLIQGPSLLLCDEPTGSLDQATADAVADLLVEMHEAEETILVVVTHSLALAQRFGRRVELRDGVSREV